jgi:hypothetical protein
MKYSDILLEQYGKNIVKGVIPTLINDVYPNHNRVEVLIK